MFQVFQNANILSFLKIQTASLDLFLFCSKSNTYPLPHPHPCFRIVNEMHYSFKSVCVKNEGW